jgi:acetoin utilization deacetylase AcuC-like enzyme/ankyrin repeat protein
VDMRDDDGCTPLHVAILHGRLEAARALLAAGARPRLRVEGSPALHLATCVGAHPEHADFAPPAVALLLNAGVVPYDRDDAGRTALHWAAQYGLEAAAAALLGAGEAFRAEQEAAAAGGAGGGGAGAVAAPNTGDAAAAAEEPLPALAELQDKQGATPLHLAARYRQAGAVVQLLASGFPTPAAKAAAARATTKAGLTPLHAAALGGDAEVVAALLAAAPDAAGAKTRQGLTAADLAARRGHAPAAALLRAAGAPPPAAAAAAAAPRAAAGRTLVLAPPECLEHRTAPSLARGADVPPENVNRLSVLTRPGMGILRTREFAPSSAAALDWDEAPHPAPLGDVLRVHDWAYVRGVQAACARLPDSPRAVGHLDGDTAVSRGSWPAALGAAGAACAAVDAVVGGDARNAFCAVRPPGHHAGPHGVVASARDPNGSHGFCLLNNVAIAAAYAMTVHRAAGIKRVALVDFDVHHGNGTEACVANAVPSVRRFEFATPYGEGVQVRGVRWFGLGSGSRGTPAAFIIVYFPLRSINSHRAQHSIPHLNPELAHHPPTSPTHHHPPRAQVIPAYKPWFSSTDADNVFFASVQGYGPKSASGVGPFVYPGSGATADNRAPVAGEAGDAGAGGGGSDAEAGAEGVGALAAIPAAGGGYIADGGWTTDAEAGDGLAEDPDGEFAYRGGEAPRREAPRVIDVGIPGGGPRVALWRRAWRDKVLPALVRFKPDLILVSAGFDAHKKDEINFAYIGVQVRAGGWVGGCWGVLGNVFIVIYLSSLIIYYYLH